MALKLTPMSIPNGTRDIAADLTKVLETSETVTGTPVAVSSNSTILSTASVGKNTAVITKEDGNTIAIGKGVQLKIATTSATVYADLSGFPGTGASGTYYYASDTGVMWEWDVTNAAYTKTPIPSSVDVRVWFDGNSGTSSRYKIIIPIKPDLTS